MSRIPYGPVEIRNSCYVLHNYDPGDNKRLEYVYSVWDKSRHRRKMLGVYYDFENRDLYIPGGCQLYTVAPSFDPSCIIPRIPPDPYDHIGKVLLASTPRDDDQKEAIRFCLGLDEYSNNRNASQLSLNLNTGKGKTYVILVCFAYYGIRTAMITSSNDWLNQWKEAILQFTDLKDDEVYIIAGAASIYKLYRLKDPRKIKFFLCTHSTLYSYGKKNGWNAIRKLFIDLRIGIKIYDEAHLYFDNICRIDFFTNCLKTYYLTATPLKSDFYENKIYQRSFETVPGISLFKSDDDPHSAYLAIKFNSRPTPYDIQAVSTGSYGFSAFAYVNYFQQKEIFYKLLHVVMVHCLNEMEEEDHMMIYFATNSAIYSAYRWLRYHFYGMTIGMYSSLVPKEMKRSQLQCKCILTTTKSAQALLDIKRLKKLVVFAEPFNSEPIARQVLGRLRDSDTEMIELIDCGFSRIYDWYRNKLRKVYTKYAISTDEISYTEQELNDAILSIVRNENEEFEKYKSTLPMLVDKEKR